MKKTKCPKCGGALKKDVRSTAVAVFKMTYCISCGYQTPYRPEEK